MHLLFSIFDNMLSMQDTALSSPVIFNVEKKTLCFQAAFQVYILDVESED